MTVKDKNRVRATREVVGMSQRELAKACQTSQQQIQRIEHGQAVTLDLACHISGALRTSINILFPTETKTMCR